MKNKKLITLLLAATMVLSLAGCGNQPVEVESTAAPTAEEEAEASAEEATGGTAEEAAPEVDLSEHVTLVFYLAGDPPTDELVIEEAVNAVLTEKFNTSLDFQFTTWTDYQQKYTNELTSGNSDLIYIANWFNYQTLAHSGAFLELDDLLDDYAPDLRARAGENVLNMCRVGGELYAVPALCPEYVPNGVTYREDLRAKYDLPVPDSLENMEAYFQGIKDNEPNQPILSVTSQNSAGGVAYSFDAFNVFELKYADVLNRYGLKAKLEDPNTLVEYWFTDEFVEDCKLMKKWADAGFWSKSALSDTGDSGAFEDGRVVASIYGQNPSKYIGSMKTLASEHPDWEAGYLAFGEITGAMWSGHATQNGTAIVRGTEYPERCVMVLQELMMNEELNKLVQCGIEGTHYELDEDGLYVKLGKDFPYEGLNTWNLRMEEYKIPQGTDLILNEMFAKYAEIGNKNKYPNVNIPAGFGEDYTEYQAERIAVSNVMSQYLAPIQAGLVEDVEASIEEFRTKVKEAGLDVCREGFKTQWEAYCSEYDYD